LPLKTLAAVFYYLALWILPTLSWAGELDIQFKVSPPAQRLRPFSDPATLSVRVARSDGRAVEQGRVDVRMLAPEPGRFFSTDFPVVEGTTLTEMRLPLRQGRIEWKYLFPIRGNYQIDIQAVTPDGDRARKSFEIAIRENEQKWLLLGIFICALFLLGVMAGRIFTSVRASTKEKIVACLFVVTACLVTYSGRAIAQERNRGRYVARLEVEPATVGKMSQIRWNLASRVGEVKPPAQLTLTVTHLEKGKTVFAVEKLLVAGEFSFQFQFTDGDDYRVSATANAPGGESVHSEQVVSVTGVEPPAKAMIPALFFFLAVITSGLGVGRWIKRGKQFARVSATD
jgi:hypothetical protein